MKLLGISGTIVGVKTSVLVQRILDEVKQKYPEIEVEMLDLRNYDLQFCDGRKLEDYNQDTQECNSKSDRSRFLFNRITCFQLFHSCTFKESY